MSKNKETGRQIVTSRARGAPQLSAPAAALGLPNRVDGPLYR